MLSKHAKEIPDLTNYENPQGMAFDLGFLALMPELCDVTFFVGDNREPVLSVRAILGARSIVFRRMLYSKSELPQPLTQKKRVSFQGEKKSWFSGKSSSEPKLNKQDSPKDPKAPLREHLNIDIEEFEADVFRQLVGYIHTGQVVLEPRTIVGLLNAAEYFGLEQLIWLCNDFIPRCITLDTVCPLLLSGERYPQFRATKRVMKQVMEFIDENGTEVLNLGAIALLPQRIVRKILSRNGMKVDEFTKFQAALMWSKKCCDWNFQCSLEKVFAIFLKYIEFRKIPTAVLWQDIMPLGLVPRETILEALAYQADPTLVELEKRSHDRSRRSTGARSASVESDDPYDLNLNQDSMPIMMAGQFGFDIGKMKRLSGGSDSSWITVSSGSDSEAGYYGDGGETE